jgi:PKD repeat protein
MKKIFTGLLLIATVLSLNNAIYAQGVAGFSYSPTTICTGVSVTFSNTSTGSPDSYSWTFGDGGTSILQSPSYTYVIGGTPTVTLITHYPDLSTSTYQTTVTVNTTPSITSTTPGISSCGGTGATVSATASAGGTINWYAAAAGGTSISNSSSPYFIAPATYYVDATLGSCTSTPRIAVTATVNPIPSAPTTTPAARCGTGAVSLGATASAGALNWYAAAAGGTSLGTGTSYSPSISSTTSYYVDATSGGCTSTRTLVTATVNALPYAPTTTSGNRCGTGTVSLGASASAGTLNWYTASAGGTPHVITGTTFTTPSISSTTTYYVDATTTGAGCISSRTAVIATVKPVPVATATSNSPVVAGSTITLTGGPTGIYSYSWSGPSFTSTAQSPTRPSSTSAMAGTYTITVSGSNGCTGTKSTTVIINSLPAAGFTVPPTTCAGKSVTFTNTTPTVTPAATWLWDFGDGTATSTLKSPTHIYTIPGPYTVTLIATNGCGSTKYKLNITVNPIVAPVISITSTPSPTSNALAICATTSVSFHTLTNTPLGNTLQWYNGSTKVGTGATYSPATLAQGNKITCLATTSAGCASTTSNPITITISPNKPVSVKITDNAAANTICEGKSVTFNASGVNGGTGATYQWYSGATGAYAQWTPVPGETGAQWKPVAGTGLTGPTGAIGCVMTSNAACATYPLGPTGATGAPSNVENMVVLSPITPTITITAKIDGIGTPYSTNVNFTDIENSSNQSVTFTVATETGGGTGTGYPKYQWKNKGINIPTAINSQWTSATLNDDDVITCVLTSDATPCLIDNPATSNTITINDITSSRIAANETGFEIYPNPTKGTLNVYFNSQNFPDATVSLINTVGKTVLVKKIDNNTSTMLDVSDLTEGIYFVRFLNDNIFYMKKVVIIR